MDLHMRSDMAKAVDILSATIVWLINISLAVLGSTELYQILLPSWSPLFCYSISVLVFLLLFIALQLLFLPLWRIVYRILTGQFPPILKIGEGTIVESANVVSIVVTLGAGIGLIGLSMFVSHRVFVLAYGVWGWVALLTVGLLTGIVVILLAELAQKILRFLLSGGLSDSISILDDENAIWRVLHAWQSLAHRICVVKPVNSAAFELRQLMLLVLQGKIEKYEQFMRAAQPTQVDVNPEIFSSVLSLLRECTGEDGKFDQTVINKRLRDFNALMEQLT